MAATPTADDTPSREEFAAGLDIPPAEERDHGTGIDPVEFADLSPEAFNDALQDLSRAERIHLLFGFEPFDYQRDLIEHTATADVCRVALQPGRQVGKTVTAAAIAADAFATTPAEDVLIAAPFQETADEMMREAKAFLREAAERLEAAGLSLGVPESDRNKREWEAEHGGRLLSRTLGVDGVGQRGKNPRVVIVDEAAYAPDAVFEDVIEPFFLTHDYYTFILISTPAGDAGYYHEKVVIDDDFHSPYWPSALSPLVDPAWLAEKRSKTDRRTFRQEYLGEFIGSSDRFFPPELVDGATETEPGYQPGAVVALGADIARAGDDRTVIVGIDRQGVASVLTSDADMTLTEASGTLAALADSHDPATIRVDETGLGAGVVEMLQEDIGRRLVEGVTFSLDRKQSLYNGLKSQLERGDLVLEHDPLLARELKKLTYSLTRGQKTKISAPDGSHDDHPDALALAAAGYRGHSGRRQRSAEDSGVSFL